jgi:hypothetical protein
MKTYVIDVNTYVIDVNTYVIDVSTSHALEEGAHIPSWLIIMIIIIIIVHAPRDGYRIEPSVLNGSHMLLGIAKTYTSGSYKRRRAGEASGSRSPSRFCRGHGVPVGS